MSLTRGQGRTGGWSGRCSIGEALVATSNQRITVQGRTELFGSGHSKGRINCHQIVKAHHFQQLGPRKGSGNGIALEYGGERWHRSGSLIPTTRVGLLSDLERNES